MSVVGEVTGVWGLLTKAWDWRQERVRTAAYLVFAAPAYQVLN